MSARATLILANDRMRQQAVRWIMKAPLGTRVEFKRARRSMDQNAKMWAMLADISRQHLWHGLRLDTGDWKLVFLDALNREMRMVPNLDGNGFVNLSRSSSDLSVGEMSDMIELMYAWGADPAHAVAWSEPEVWAHEAPPLLIEVEPVRLLTSAGEVS